MRERRRRRSFITLALILIVVLGSSLYLVLPQGFNLWGRLQKGLDLVGGVHIVFQAYPTEKTPVTEDAMKSALAILTKRVDALGLTEPVIQQEGRDRIVLDLPGVTNPEEVAQTIGRTAVLEFREPGTSPGQPGPVFLTGADLVKATPVYDPQQGWLVQLQFNDAGAKAMRDFTSTHIGQQMLIYLDGELLQAPVVRDTIPNGVGVITGYASFDDANAIAVALNSGALPLDLRIIENRQVSASLGADSMAASEKAVILASALVILFMMVWYRIPGFWADIALIVYIMLLFLALYGLGATLTLPAITGMVLSVGMAVDGNIVIFERIREELRLGRSLRNAVDQGFKHGVRVVIDSSVTTVLAASMLFIFGTGPVKGFAITLSLGVLISLFTAVTFTRWVLRLQVDTGARPSFWFFAPPGYQGPAGEVTR